jgi:hypothetical protein
VHLEVPQKAFEQRSLQPPRLTMGSGGSVPFKLTPEEAVDRKFVKCTQG